MAKIDLGQTVLTVQIPGTKPTISPSGSPATRYDFNSPTIDLYASIRLAGDAGESVAGWILGFVQLKYIGTNHARYLGAKDSDGSALVTRSNQILCRDTDEPGAEIWYDPLLTGSGTTGPMGTNQLASGMVLPATKVLTVPAHLFDQPHRFWDTVRPNALTGKPNYLRYAVVELLFCTMLVAQEPGGKRHMLKHVYWNVIWEHTFKRDQFNHVLPDKAVRLQQNIQHPVHSGNPLDQKFFGKEYDLTLPVSNTVSNKPAKTHVVKDGSQG